MREHYLEKMGITVWRERNLIGSSVKADLCYVSFRSSSVILVAAVASDAEKVLFEKIASAVSADFTLSSSIELSASTTVFVFGNCVSQQNARVIDVPSLSVLLVDREAKRVLWEALKKHAV